MNPATLETIKCLAGVCNAERIEGESKTLANKMLLQLLKMVEKDVNSASALASGITL